jgi:hypothetical protein
MIQYSICPTFSNLVGKELEKMSDYLYVIDSVRFQMSKKRSDLLWDVYY